MPQAQPADRDYCQDMAGVINKHTGIGPYVPRIAAAEIVTKLLRNDPDLLHGWLQAQAIHFIWQAINDRDRSIRAATRARAGRVAFREAHEAHLAGDPQPLRRFLDLPFTVADGSRRRLAVMNGRDCQFVSADYGKRARQNRMMELFMAALAKKVGDRFVEDVYSEEQLSAMFRSLNDL